MFKHKRKPAKEALKDLKRFVNGEDLTTDLSPGYDLSMLTTEQLTELHAIDDDHKRGARYREMVKDGKKLKATWFEEGEGDEIPGFNKPSWFHDADDSKEYTPTDKNQVLNYKKVEPPKRSFTQRVQDFFSSSEETHEVSEDVSQEAEIKPGSQESLKIKMAEIDKQMEQDLEIRDQFLLWKRMNT